MAVVLLIAAVLLGLIMIPFGMPGTLIMFVAALCYYLLVPGGGIGLITVIGVGVLVAIAEGLEWILATRFTKKYGGSRRAGWGAIIGGMIGAFVSIPTLPIVGPIIGGFLGAFIGAFVFEWTRGTGSGTATRVAWGAFIGRVTAAAMKVAIGFVIAAWMMVALL